LFPDAIVFEELPFHLFRVDEDVIAKPILIAEAAPKNRTGG
jgi:hypothetical protein